MAPLVTTTTRWPASRAAATSAQNFPTASTSISPDGPVIDDVPILTTTMLIRRSRS
jgi:hypothetical protein